MRATSIQWRNVNSYGNITQRIDFPPEGGLYNLHGPNGAGKTTIAEVLTFAQYGKVDGKNKSDLVNMGNKAMWCRYEGVSRTGKKVAIERGVSPSLFTVEIDGEQVDTAGTSNVQDFLEEEVFDVPYAVYRNMLVVRIGDFKSFLTMTPADKRNIVDRLFGFAIINQMKELLKVERKEVKEVASGVAADLRSINETVSAMEARLEVAEKQGQVDRDKILAELKDSIRDCKAAKEKADADLGKVRTVAGRLAAERGALVRDGDRLSHELRAGAEKLRLLDTGKCPYCESDLTGEFHTHETDSLRSKAATASAEAQRVEAEVSAVRSKEGLLAGKLRQLEDDSASLERRLSRMMADARAMLSHKDEGPDALRSLLADAGARLSEKQAVADSSRAEDAFLGVVDEVLSDGGVKSYAMKSILPSLNQAIHETSKKMHVPYDVRLDESFDCVVTHLGEQISHRMMSSGERKKADIAIVISIVKMLKMRYPSLNVLFLDELFQSIDSAGVYEITKMLAEMCREHSMNIWVMHHADLPVEMFDKQVKVTKDAGFSKIQVEAV